MKTFYEAIYEWVAENYGQSEADSPSWSIEALADRLSNRDIKPDELNANTKTMVYDQMREHYLEEDIEQVAESRGLTLEKWQVEAIKHRYYKLDDETWEQIAMLMDELNLKKGE